MFIKSGLCAQPSSRPRAEEQTLADKGLYPEAVHLLQSVRGASMSRQTRSILSTSYSTALCVRNTSWHTVSGSFFPPFYLYGSMV